MGRVTLSGDRPITSPDARMGSDHNSGSVTYIHEQETILFSSFDYPSTSSWHMLIVIGSQHVCRVLGAHASPPKIR